MNLPHSKRPPEVSWIHCCDYAALGANNKGILVGIFNRVLVDKVPFTPPLPFYVVFELTDGLGEYDVGLQIEPPGGEIATIPPRKMLLPHPLATAAWIGALGYRFDCIGKYGIVPVIDGEPHLAKRTVIDVVRKPQ